ncbi:MAG: hypothetical protein V4568_14555 [Pseudomonadota bacterium]
MTDAHDEREEAVNDARRHLSICKTDVEAGPGTCGTCFIYGALLSEVAAREAAEKERDELQILDNNRAPMKAKLLLENNNLRTELLDLACEVSQLRADCEAYRGALEFYADPSNYRGMVHESPGPMFADRQNGFGAGYYARSVLEKSSPGSALLEKIKSLEMENKKLRGEK